METVSAGPDTLRKVAEDFFINGHGPYNGIPDSVPVGTSGVPDACAEEAPLEGACQTCQTQANLRRWTG